VKRTVLILAVLTLTISGCGGDSGTSPQTGGDTQLAADTIGAGGGTLVADEFELTVPAGAFDSDAELTLYESSDDHGFGTSCVSRFFRLEGLPETFDDALTVRIGYEGTLSGSTYVAVGEEAAFYDESGEASDDFLYHFHLATESSGYLEASIPPRASAARNAAPGLRAASETEDVFAAVSGVGINKSSAHFRIRYPLSVFAHVDDVVNYLEAAHDMVVSIGMGYAGMPWSWPATVVITEFIGKSPTRYHASSRGLHIGVKTSVLTEINLPEVRRWLGNNMVLSAMSIPNTAEYFGADNIAWNIAVMSYMQELWADPGGYTGPTGLVGNESYTMQGLPIGIPEASRVPYGYGWSPVVKHLAGLYGNTLIGDVYKVTQTTDKNPVKVLFEKIPDPAYNWWPQFVDKFVTGQYYGVEGSVLLSHVASGDKYTIDSATDTLTTFYGDLPQVSARMYRVYLDYALISENASLELSLTATDVNEDYYTLIVYKTRDGVLELVGSGNPVTVNGLKDLTVAGYDIVPVAVVSYNDEPYLDDVSTALRCRVTSPPPYNWAFISFNSVNAHFVDSYDNDWWDNTWGGMWEGTGSWNGNKFNASWTNREIPSGGTTSGSLTITIDPETRDVTSFRARRTWLSIGFTFVDSIVGGNVPFDYQTAGHRLCQTVGTGACSSASVYAYKRVRDETGVWIEVDNFNCQPATYLTMSFWYEAVD